MSGGHFQVGDVAVKCGGPCTTIPMATLCRVEAITIAQHRDGPVQALTLRGWAHKPATLGFDARNFRKLPKASYEFTTDLRARLNNRVPA